jgi:hypothetical protein
MVEENKEQFPQECPICGEKERLLSGTMDRLKKEGKLSKEAFSKGAALQIPLIDPGRLMKIVSPTIKIYTLIIYYDICANPECGCFYLTGFEVVEQPAQMQPMGPGGRPVGPPMNFKGGQPGPN